MFAEELCGTLSVDEALVLTDVELVSVLKEVENGSVVGREREFVFFR